MHGFAFCTWAFSRSAGGGYSLLWCVGFSLQWLLLMGSTDSRRVGIASCGSSCWGAQTLGEWASLVVAPRLSGPGIKPVSPALAGGFLPTVPPAKSLRFFFLVTNMLNISGDLWCFFMLKENELQRWKHQWSSHMFPVVLVAQLLWSIELAFQSWSKLGLKETPLLLESSAKDNLGAQCGFY